jgi:hypothetical protein
MLPRGGLERKKNLVFKVLRHCETILSHRRLVQVFQLKVKVRNEISFECEILRMLFDKHTTRFSACAINYISACCGISHNNRTGLVQLPSLSHAVSKHICKSRSKADLQQTHFKISIELLIAGGKTDPPPTDQGRK